MTRRARATPQLPLPEVAPAAEHFAALDEAAKNAYRERRERDQREMAESPLGVALAVAVPLWIARFQRLDEDAYAALYDRGRIEGLLELVCYKGDALLFRDKRERLTAAVFNATAEAIAQLSFCPGGVTVFGHHFESMRTGAAGRVGDV